MEFLGIYIPGGIIGRGKGGIIDAFNIHGYTHCCVFYCNHSQRTHLLAVCWIPLSIDDASLIAVQLDVLCCIYFCGG
jgi:hypothetical protein